MCRALAQNRVDLSISRVQSTITQAREPICPDSLNSCTRLSRAATQQLAPPSIHSWARTGHRSGRPASGSIGDSRPQSTRSRSPTFRRNSSYLEGAGMPGTGQGDCPGSRGSWGGGPPRDFCLGGASSPPRCSGVVNAGVVPKVSCQFVGEGGDGLVDMRRSDAIAERARPQCNVRLRRLRRLRSIGRRS